MSEQQKRVNIKYPYAGKEPLEDIIYKSFPRQLRPTKKTNTYLGIIFLIVLAIAFIEFPYGSLTTGNTDITIKVGYPLPFLQFNLSEIETNPLLIGGLILDLILYVFIAYLADIITNLILNNKFLISEEDSKKNPKTFEDKKDRTIAEKLTKKVVEKTSPLNINKPSNPPISPANNTKPKIS